MATQADVKTEAVLPKHVLRAANAIGATPAKLGGPVGKYLYDIDLANAAMAALKAVAFEELLAAVTGAMEHMEWSTPQGCAAYNALDDAKGKALRG